ncbi:MAG: sigma-70 family RNA polymerase sigma factor [Deltaproteobacteria bacterium]|nr:sigma-70 family RNA polymerase sigma factor [Deltaproteobacteria bacterium]
MTFGDLFEAHAAFVFRCVRHLGAREADVPDCAQEVFLVAHQKREQLRESAGARSWLYRICFHVVRNHQRLAHVRRERPSEAPAARLRNPTPADPVERRETRSRLESVLMALDADKRAVLVAHAIEEMSMREIAEALQIPQKTAYSRLYAARRSARAIWEESDARDPKQGGAR